jgi:hypothetical protein
MRLHKQFIGIKRKYFPKKALAERSMLTERAKADFGIGLVYL